MKYGVMKKYLEPDGGQGGEPTGNEGTQSKEQGQQPAFDYDKLASIIAGKQTVTEDTVLKNYFKQKGLSAQEAEQAIASFKAQKEAAQPNVEALQQKAESAAAEARQAQIQQAATMAAVGLGISVTSIPYVLKMADFSQAVEQDGKISNEKLTEALNKVLKDIPALKPQDAGNNGFLQIGNGGDPSQHTKQATVQQQTPAKRWNRWN